MNITELRSLTPENIEDLLGLMRELNPELHITPQMLKMAVEDPATRFFAAIEDGRIVGTASLCISHSPTGRKGGIEDVVVSSKERGKHLGRALMEHIIGFAREELSPIQLHLTSRPSREKANLLYQAVGFTRYETNVYKLDL